MPTPLHPAVVHLPIALALLMPLVMVMIGIGIWKDLWSRKTWWLVVVLQLILAASTFAALKTGEQEEERVEAVVGKHFIEAHEERAELFLILAATMLAPAVFAGFVRAKRMMFASILVAFLGSIAVLGAALSTGQLGGKLVYQHGAASAYGQAPTIVPHED